MPRLVFLNSKLLDVFALPYEAPRLIIHPFVPLRALVENAISDGWEIRCYISHSATLQVLNTMLTGITKLQPSNGRYRYQPGDRIIVARLRKLKGRNYLDLREVEVEVPP